MYGKNILAIITALSASVAISSPALAGGGEGGHHGGGHGGGHHGHSGMPPVAPTPPVVPPVVTPPVVHPPVVITPPVVPPVVTPPVVITPPVVPPTNNGSNGSGVYLPKNSSPIYYSTPSYPGNLWYFNRFQKAPQPVFIPPVVTPPNVITPPEVITFPGYGNPSCADYPNGYQPIGCKEQVTIPDHAKPRSRDFD